MKTLLLVLSFMTCVIAEAKDLYFPIPADKPAYLKISNKTTSTSYAFLQYRDQSKNLEEVTFLIPAQSERKINIKEIAPVSQWVLFKTESLIQTSFEIKDEEHWIEFAESADLSKNINVVVTHDKIKILVANLSPLENKIALSLPSPKGVLQRSMNLPPYGTKELLIEPTSFNEVLKLEGTQRLRILAWSEFTELTQKKQREKMVKDSAKRYFIFGTRTGPQFTVGLSDPLQIQRARELIKKPGSLGSILSAQVGFGSQNHNFNLVSHPTWSWQVEQVFGFADLGSTECNGDAQTLEESAEEWIGSQKTICFWNARPLREIEDFEQ